MASREPILRELEVIRRANAGILRPPDVVEFAGDPETALHSCFTWDDTKAAEEYRLWQARQLIRVTVLLLPGDDRPIRAYVSLRQDRSVVGGGYRAMVDMLSDKDGRRAVLAEAKADWEVFAEKHDHLRELAPLFRAGRRLFGIKTKQLVGAK